MSDILSENDARLKFEQLKMLAASVLRAKEDFLEKPSAYKAIVLQNIQNSYRNAFSTMKPRAVE